MFNYVGERIQQVGKILCWIGVGGSVIGGLYLLILGINDDWFFILFGLLAMVLGSLLAWLSSLFVIGFGMVVENTAYLPQYAARAAESSRPDAPGEEEAAPFGVSPLTKLAEETKHDGWICNGCGANNDKNARQCKTCGKYR